MDHGHEFSGRASYITGAEVPVDGGHTAHGVPAQAAARTRRSPRPARPDRHRAGLAADYSHKVYDPMPLCLS